MLLSINFIQVEKWLQHTNFLFTLLAEKGAVYVHTIRANKIVLLYPVSVVFSPVLSCLAGILMIFLCKTWMFHLSNLIFKNNPFPVIMINHLHISRTQNLIAVFSPFISIVFILGGGILLLYYSFGWWDRIPWKKNCDFLKKFLNSILLMWIL